LALLVRGDILMTARIWLSAGALVLLSNLVSPTLACCPVARFNIPVVNADQTVVILWDPATKTEHFIRQASFKSEADDFGFLVPSPTQPELSESGDPAFSYLQKLTEPETRTIWRPTIPIGCHAMSMGSALDSSEVRVLEQKIVAGYKASVLEAGSGDAFVRWLKENGYAYSPEVQAWAKPYIEAGWKITALKVAKPEGEKQNETVGTSALRISFATDKPLFPYREADPHRDAKALGARHRLLRIYFLADARYQGTLTRDHPWTGKVMWAGKLDGKDREKLLDLLKLPQNTGPAQWWLTEFEDEWPYEAAPADLYFSRDPTQRTVRRPPIYEYSSVSWPTDVTTIAIAGVLMVPPILRRVRQGRQV
jgi:hypothetical protein